MSKDSINKVIVTRIRTTLEGARSNAGDAYEAGDMIGLKAEIKEVETYFKEALKGNIEEECSKAHQLISEGLTASQSAFESKNLNEAKQLAKTCMEKAIQALEEVNECYKS